MDQEESQFDGDYAGADEALMRKRRIKKKKKVVQIFNDPSDKDKQMAKAYGGVPRGGPKRQVQTRTAFRDTETPKSQMQNRASKQNMVKISEMVSGFNRDSNEQREHDPKHA